MIALFTAIYSAFDAATTLKAALSGGLHRNEAPQETAYPYAVMFIVSNTPDDTLTEDGEDIQLQFNIFSESDSQLMTIFGLLDAVYNKGALTITGYDHIMTLREFNSIIKTDVPHVWQYSARYRIVIEKQ